MKNLLYLLILLCCQFLATAQSLPAGGKDDTLPDSSYSLFARYTPVSLRLVDGASFLPERLDGLYNHFEVIDDRLDTSRVGVHATRTRSNNSFSRQLVFGQPASKEIASYLNRHFARSDAPYTCLIVIRTLWLSDVSFSKEESTKETSGPVERTRIRFTAEIYAAKDSVYTPVFRYKNLLRSNRSSVADFSKNLSEMLRSLGDSSSVLLAAKRNAGRQISLREIREFNQTRVNIPISNETTPKKGVYTSFEEFRNNEPSTQNCELRRLGDDLILYIKEAGGRSLYSRDAWGYCDGKNMFIMRDGLLRPAWREGKAWYLLGSASLDKGGPVAIPAGIVHPTPALPLGAAVIADAAILTIAANTKKEPSLPVYSRVRIFAVDMENGGTY